LLAEQLGADRLLILTDVPYILRDWDMPEQTAIDRTAPAELRKLEFAAGSMAPKVEAVCGFVERTGAEAVIGSLAELTEIAAGNRGTRVEPNHAREATV
jgi:carbamate kinase